MQNKQEKNENGFQTLLKSVANEISNDDSNLLKNFITLNGKLEYELGSKSLNFKEQAIYQVISKRENIKLSKCFNDFNFFIKISYTLTGKPSLTIQDKMVDKENEYLIGYISINSKEIDSIEEKYYKHKIKEFQYCKEIKKFFDTSTYAEVYKMVKHIHFTLYHMAPGFCYLDNSIFSSFYEHNNLLEELSNDKDTVYLLNDLLVKDIKLWTEAEKKYIYNMFFLLNSGGPSRGEEFNGFQIYCINIHDFFDKTYKEYSLAMDKKENFNFNILSIADKSKTLKEYREQINADFLFVREINGLTVHKKEKLIKRTQLNDLDWNRLPRDIKNYLWDKGGNELLKDDLPKLFENVVENLLKNENSNSSYKYKGVEKLLNIILSSVLNNTDVDLVMTRSIRYFNRFLEAIDNDDVEEIMNWKQSKYFCFVKPSSSMKQAFNNQNFPLSSVLKAVSTRMQYNSWHYIPGHFSVERVPKSRHFYFPPKMPDTAIWSDKHHIGHVNSRVKNSIRSPDSINYKGNEYFGFFDLRLMKQSGREFDDFDLIESIFYTKILKLVYQSIVNIASKTQLECDIESFKKDWYNKHYDTTKGLTNNVH